MRHDLPRGQLALLFTDIEGSTRLLHRLGAEGYGLAQAEHRDLLRRAFRAHGGVEVDTQGDAFFYVFPCALQCLQGAVAGTRALARHPWAHGERVKVRMGVHYGEPQPTDEGYVGMVVNTAARVAAAGHGEQILLTAAAADDVELVSTGVTLKDLGAHRLKDLDEPLHLFQVVIPELVADFPPLRSTAARPNNLPSPVTPFIGRSALVAHVRDMLQDSRCRAVTLLGPGGTGKSRLALQVARELLHSLEDGAFFVGLAAIRDPALVLPAVAGALGVKEAPGQPIRDTIAAYLSSRRILLVLDNFEQVEDSARDVAALIAACPGLKVLATSRQPLRIKGEQRIPVPPMALPDPGERLPPVELVAEFEAVRLFIETAADVCWDFELSSDNVAQVVEICRRVDALPLAIELATAKLATMSMAELQDALNDRLDTLTDGSVDLLDHQQSLRDLVAWSYNLLNDAERRLWRRMAAFAGGGSLEAVQAICDIEQEYRFPRDVDNLVTKSLVNLEFASPVPGGGGGKRAVMLETLRDYAHERLLETDEADELCRRHARWYRALAADATDHLRGPMAATWLARLDRDQGNFRAAMEFGFAHQGGAADAARIAGALWFYWYERGMFQEGQRWLELAAGAEVPPAEKAQALLGLANLERIQGEHAQALAHCRQALEAFRLSGNELGVADALSQLGAIRQHVGDFEAAEAHLTDAVERLRRLAAEPRGSGSDQLARGRLAFTLVLLGALKQLRDDLAGAEADYSESLALGRLLGDQNYIATALVNLGELMQLRGQLARSAELLRESLALYHELGVRNAVAYCLELLGGLSIAADEFERGAMLFGAADRLRELLNAPLESFNQQRYQQDLASARAGAGDPAFQDAWNRGRAMPLPELVEFAAYGEADAVQNVSTV